MSLDDVYLQTVRSCHHKDVSRARGDRGTRVGEGKGGNNSSSKLGVAGRLTHFSLRYGGGGG